MQINKEIDYLGRIFKPVKCFKKPLMPQGRLRRVIGKKKAETVSKINSVNVSKYFSFTEVCQHGISIQYGNYFTNSFVNRITLHCMLKTVLKEDSFSSGCHFLMSKK